jgi:hypothetical protein
MTPSRGMTVNPSTSATMDAPPIASTPESLAA